MTAPFDQPCADRPAPGANGLSAFERRLLNEFQRDFPLVERPFAEIARRLGESEEAVLAALARLSEARVVSRVGGVVAPHQAGWSTLAAMAVPADRVEAVASLVNGYDEVNHNYEREHRFNLWFVVTAADKERVGAVLADIELRTGLSVLDLPLTEPYHLDLGFDLQWP